MSVVLINVSTFFAKTQDDLIAELIYFYQVGNSETDTLRTLDAIKEKSDEDHEMWSSIINYWHYVDNEMPETIDKVPGGLPNSNKHAFVVLDLH